MLITARITGAGVKFSEELIKDVYIDCYVVEVFDGHCYNYIKEKKNPVVYHAIVNGVYSKRKKLDYYINFLHYIADSGYNIKAITLFNEIFSNNTRCLKPCYQSLNFDTIVNIAKELLPNSDLLIGDYRLIDIRKWWEIRRFADKYGLGIWLQPQHSQALWVLKNTLYEKLYLDIISNYKCYMSEVSFWGPNRYDNLAQLYYLVQNKVETFGTWVFHQSNNYVHRATGDVNNVFWYDKNNQYTGIREKCLGQ